VGRMNPLLKRGIMAKCILMFAVKRREHRAWTVEPWLLTRLGGWVRENPSHQVFVAKDLADLDGLAQAPHAGVDKEE
jgi:hypothetical protein